MTVCMGEAWKGVVPEVQNEGRFQVSGLQNAAIVLSAQEHFRIEYQYDEYVHYKKIATGIAMAAAAVVLVAMAMAMVFLVVYLSLFNSKV